VVAGIAVSRDGKTFAAANFENDSLSIVDTTSRTPIREVHFFNPGETLAQGEYPYDVAIVSDKDGAARTAYVTSLRDDQVMVVDVQDRQILIDLCRRSAESHGAFRRSEQTLCCEREQ
jgi:DNA-binding beta-propeller fold protein YncE